MDVSSLFEMAQLSQAACAKLSDGYIDDQGVLALQKQSGMTYTQAAQFSSTWLVVDQFNDELTAGQLELGLGTGLSVTGLGSDLANLLNQWLPRDSVAATPLSGYRLTGPATNVGYR